MGAASEAELAVRWGHGPSCPAGGRAGNEHLPGPPGQAGHGAPRPVRQEACRGHGHSWGKSLKWGTKRLEQAVHGAPGLWVGPRRCSESSGESASSHKPGSVRISQGSAAEGWSEGRVNVKGTIDGALATPTQWCGRTGTRKTFASPSPRQPADAPGHGVRANPGWTRGTGRPTGCVRVLRSLHGVCPRPV